jgi:hypothetical protein
MPSTSWPPAVASLLVSLLSLWVSGSVLAHYIGVYFHVRSGVGRLWTTPLGAFLALTAPWPSAFVAGIIAAALLLAWLARYLVRSPQVAGRIGLVASAIRLSGLAQLFGGFDAVVLIGLLAARTYLLGW